MRRAVTEVVGLCILAALPAVVAAVAGPHRPAWNPQDLKKDEVLLVTALRWPQVVWVDARSKEAYEQQHMPEAVLLNEDAWERNLVAFLERWQPGVRVVVYCNSGSCQASRAVARRLREEVGLDAVYVLKGGWQAWLDATH